MIIPNCLISQKTFFTKRVLLTKTIWEWEECISIKSLVFTGLPLRSAAQETTIKLPNFSDLIYHYMLNKFSALKTQQCAKFCNQIPSEFTSHFKYWLWNNSPANYSSIKVLVSPLRTFRVYFFLLWILTTQSANFSHG